MLSARWALQLSQLGLTITYPQATNCTNDRTGLIARDWTESFTTTLRPLTRTSFPTGNCAANAPKQRKIRTRRKENHKERGRWAAARAPTDLRGEDNTALLSKHNHPGPTVTPVPAAFEPHHPRLQTCGRCGRTARTFPPDSVRTAGPLLIIPIARHNTTLPPPDHPPQRPRNHPLPPHTTPSRPPSRSDNQSAQTRGGNSNYGGYEVVSVEWDSGKGKGAAH